MGNIEAGCRGASASFGSGMSKVEKKARLQMISQRRLEALPRFDETDDMVWAVTCKAWTSRDPALLLLEFARMVKVGERVPSPLMEWLADAAEASMLKPAESRGNELLIELGLRLRGRPLVQAPINGANARLLRMKRWAGGRRGPTIRALAKKYGVSVGTIIKRLGEAQATQAEANALVRGLALTRQYIKL